MGLMHNWFQVEWKGLSGPIEFKEGRRVKFKLDLVKLKQQSLVKVGEWSPQSGLNITDRSIFFDTGRINVTLLVITILVSAHTQIYYYLSTKFFSLPSSLRFAFYVHFYLKCCSLCGLVQNNLFLFFSCLCGT